MLKQLILILLFIILYFSDVKSQEIVWTLDSCIRYALENSPRINNQAARNNITEQDYLESVGNLMPSLSASIGANFNFGRQLDPETNNYNNINSFSNSYSVYSSMNLFSGFSRINTVRMQKINRLRGKEQLDEIKDIISYETMEAYLNILYVKEIYKLAELQLNESKDKLEQIKKMEQLGMKSNSDVAELTAKEASDNYNLTKQRNLLANAVLQLKEKMNFPLDSELYISEYEILQTIQKTEESAEEIYQNALSSYSKILSAEYYLKASKMSYNASKGYLFPKFNVEAGFSTGFSRYMDGNTPYDPFKEQLKNRQGYYIGFSLSLPLFNGFYYTSNVKRSKQNLIIAENERNEILYSVYVEIEQAIADMNGQADAYIQARQQTEAITLAHSANQKKYDEGLISDIELTTSSNRLLSARIEEINAKYMFCLKYRLVRYYKGENFLDEKL